MLKLKKDEIRDKTLSHLLYYAIRNKRNLKTLLPLVVLYVNDNVSPDISLADGGKSLYSHEIHLLPL